MLEIGNRVTVIDKDRKHYQGKSGVVEQIHRRDDKPYIGVKFPGVNHTVWFFEEDLA